jgi:hypothetical protein
MTAAAHHFYQLFSLSSAIFSKTRGIILARGYPAELP